MSRWRLPLGSAAGLIIVAGLIAAPFGLKPYGIYILTLWAVTTIAAIGLNLTLGYHLPCHLRALEVGSPGENLLRLIKGVTVRRIERGCSGMAGTFGLKRENYRASLRAGWGLIRAVRDPGVQLGATECSACKIQMEQGTSKPTIHPIKVLALAYGIMPEIESLLSAHSGELTVT